MVSKIVEEILNPFLEKNSLRLYDVEFVKEGPDRYLRVFIDSDRNIDIKDCELVSNFLSEQLDKKDPIKENYYLEVSSPGAERFFKSQSDYDKFQGSLVEVKLNRLQEGQSKILGYLISNSESKIELRLKDKKKSRLEIDRTNIKSIRNILEF